MKALAEGPKAKYRRSWKRMPDDERLEKLVFYLATGEDYSAGRVHMVNVWGNRLTSVGLVTEGAPTGMAFHKGKDGGGLVITIPRNKGRIMRIGYEGKASTELAAAQGLPHPVDVAIGGDSDDAYVVDDIANSLGYFKSGPREQDLRLQRLLPASAGRRRWAEPAHVGRGHAVTNTLLPPVKLGCTVIQASRVQTPPSQVWRRCGRSAVGRVGGGPTAGSDLRLQRRTIGQDSFSPSGMVHYRDGRLAFSNDDGWLCVACQKVNGEADDGIQLYLCYDIEKGQYERLFGWGPKYWATQRMANIVSTDKDINDFVVGPWLRWPGAPPPRRRKIRKVTAAENARRAIIPPHPTNGVL